ncbi:hypothetical protein ACN469_17665 [Corallococcus terminator]
MSIGVSMARSHVSQRSSSVFHVSHRGPGRWLSSLARVLLVLVAWSSDVRAQVRGGGEELREGWLYRWGDSPLGPDGVPVWAREAETRDWQPMQALRTPPGREKHTLMWVSIHPGAMVSASNPEFGHGT